VWCGAEGLSANHGNEAGMNVLSEGRGLGAWRMTKCVRAFVAARGCAATSHIHTRTHARVERAYQTVCTHWGGFALYSLPISLPPSPTTTSTISTPATAPAHPPPTMASLNTSSNGPNITRSYQNVVNAPPPSGTQASSPTYGQWAVFTVAAPLVSAFQGDSGKESVLKVQSTGGM
jgi:hypothetical protein